MKRDSMGKRLVGIVAAAGLALSLLPGSAWAAIYDGEREETGKKSVKVTLQYQYSTSGGMAGINAHTAETVEFFLNEDGTTTPEAWLIPYFDPTEENNEYHNHNHNNLEGFRVVLDTRPLDQYMVKPPSGNETAEELADALNRGDFNVRDGVSEEDLTTAWVEGRTYTDPDTGLTFQIVDKMGHDGHGSAALEGPRLILKNPEDVTGNQEVTLTVTYRRDNGSYTVRHWEPKSELTQPDINKPEDWNEVLTENKQGRIGAMTTAQARFIYGYMNLAIAQQPIAADGTTEINIFYIKDDTFRVVFDTSTCNEEIGRQASKLGETVDFSPAAVPTPTRDGYRFVGWSYWAKDAAGNRGEQTPVTDAPDYNSAAKTLTLSESFLNGAYFQPSQESAGVNVLRLYPMWEPAATQVRVVFWTEDLTGEADDVDSRVKGTSGPLRVVTHHYDEEDAAYSNAGSVVLTDVRTGCALNVDVDLGTLTYTNSAGDSTQLELRPELAKLPAMAITTSYEGNDSRWRLTDAAGFFTLDGYTVTQTDGAAQTEQAANTGTTVVNLYYTRNVYQLEFIYSTVSSNEETVVSVNTNGYASSSNKEGLLSLEKDGEHNKDKVMDEADVARIPPRQIITAKYGAALRDLWPCHNDLAVNGNPHNTVRFIAWTPTEGPYNAEATRVGGKVNVTIKGDYGSMSADIIGAPENYIDIENETYSEAKAHWIYAYWTWYNPSYYRYNHCYEVPGVTRTMLEDEGVAVLLDGQSGGDVRNIVYLVPADSGGEVMSLLKGYAFDDLGKVSLADPDRGANGVVTDPDGGYYAFRVYEGKCYALARYANVVATNTIANQNPSARSHMTQKNTVADHSTKWNNGDGEFAKPIGSGNDPVQLFYYYDRDAYTVYYSVGAHDLGQKTIYYGARFSQDYNIQLESGHSVDGVDTSDVRTNDRYALSAQNPNGWELPRENGKPVSGVNVCPDRNPQGTMPWTFRGWALDQSGAALLENKDEDWDSVVSGNVRLYAQWEAPAYTVEFDWNGGRLDDPGEAEYQTQTISANSSLRRGGVVPTLQRQGYSQVGWEITHRRIGEEWARLTPAEEFRVDGAITADLRVRATWKELEGTAPYTYTVIYVLDNFYVSDEEQTVYVAAAQTVSGNFVPGSMVWASPIQLEGAYADYIPTHQNGSSGVPLEGTEIEPIVITYRPPTDPVSFIFWVYFREWNGTELIHSAQITAGESSKTVYAGSYVSELDAMGYWLVDEQGNRMSQSDDSLLVTLRDGESYAAWFLVGEQVYDIRYALPEGMDEELWAEMEEPLPKSYTPLAGAVELPIPGTNGTYEQDGKLYGFTGWKLQNGTEVGRPNDPDATSVMVTIDPGSRGTLTFQAQWAEGGRGVDFRPGDHGVFADERETVSFDALEEKPLGEQETFAVPQVTVANGYTFRGWKLSGDTTGKLYTGAEIAALTPAVGRTVFTAQYEVKRSPTAPSTPSTEEKEKHDPDDPNSWLERKKHEAYIVGRDNGLVAPEDNITRAEVVTIFYRLLTAESRAAFTTRENRFWDVSEEDWFFEATAAMAKAGIVEGRPEGCFAPGDNITRGEFATIAARFLGETEDTRTHFSDIAGHWAEEYIDRAAQAGWIKGYPDGTFRPDNSITRAEAISLVNAVLERKPDEDGLHRDMITWPDNMDTTKWYYLDVQEATNSHEYTIKVKDGQRIEVWTALRKYQGPSVSTEQEASENR